MDAVRSCVKEGAKVVSMSLGCANCYSEIWNLFSRDVYDQDILIIAAAGNSGYEVYGYPASYKTVMSVASVTEGDGEDSETYGELSSFSTHNDQVEIAAPGRLVCMSLHPFLAWNRNRRSHHCPLIQQPCSVNHPRG